MNKLAKIKFVFFYWLIWVLVFEIGRFLFLMYNFQYSRSFSTSILLRTFYHGLRMDASMAGYLLFPVCIFLIFGIFLNFFSKPGLYKIYTAIILLPVLIIIFCDLPVYRTWGNRLDTTALKYLSSPKEAWASVSNLPVFWIFIFFVLSYFLLYRWFRHLIKTNAYAFNNKSNKVFQLIVLIVFTGILVIPIRGGIQQSPLNQSGVYFSKENFLNLAAINAPWNFMYTMNQRAGSTKNPYNYLDTAEAKKIKDSLLVQKGTPEKIIDLQKTPAPNIIIIVWESFIEKGTHASKGGHEVTPRFNELKKEGVYFSNIYCSGDRTDKGIVAVLSGYPAQPITSIIKIPRKAAQLPRLPKEYFNKKYNTSFYYGGELEFANMKSYLLGCGFQDFISKGDFEEKDQNSKWGAHDHIVKDMILKDLSKTPEPFFNTWLTLSSHEPFETPVPNVISGNDDESLFFNALHYTDSTIYDFVQQCKQQPWWSNTIIIITADHGHRLPLTGRQIDDFKIPLLWLGGALSRKGIEINKTGSQVDIAATLLGQTGIAQPAFSWSKDLLNHETKEWAYFSVYNLFGFVQPGRYYIFDNISKQVIEQSGNVTPDDIKAGKAVEQESFSDYLSK